MENILNILRGKTIKAGNKFLEDSEDLFPELFKLGKNAEEL